MADSRTNKEIEQGAKSLHQTWFMRGREWGRETRQEWEDAWAALTRQESEGWIELAKSIRGARHHESSTSGGWPTANQADRIRDDLRKSYPPDLWWEIHSLIGETRPYGEMVVIFQAKARLPGAKVDVRPIRAFLIHPDGHFEELHKEKVPDGPYVTTASA